VGCCLGACGWQEAERAYLLWKARQVMDAAVSFALAARPLEGDTPDKVKRRCLEAMPETLRGRAAAGGGEALPGVSVRPVHYGVGPRTRAALVEQAVRSLKYGVFEELMEMMG
jgi:hypothetical protein